MAFQRYQMFGMFAMTTASPWTVKNYTLSNWTFLWKYNNILQLYKYQTDKTFLIVMNKLLRKMLWGFKSNYDFLLYETRHWFHTCLL